GAQSTRPGATLLPPEEEWQRLVPALTAIRKSHPGALLSVDTFHPIVAGRALEEGADLINDVSAGEWDDGLFDIVARHGAPYVLMHAKGRPGTMQQQPS